MKGYWGDRIPKTQEATLFTMTVYNSENSIRNTTRFCRPLFCHRNVVRYTSSLLKLWTRNETQLTNITEIAPLTSLAGSAPGSKRAFVPLWKVGLRTKNF